MKIFLKIAPKLCNATQMMHVVSAQQTDQCANSAHFYLDEKVILSKN